MIVLAFLGSAGFEQHHGPATNAFADGQIKSCAISVSYTHLEVEFPSEEVAVEYEGPEWFDDEVTFDSRYQNNNLANKMCIRDRCISLCIFDLSSFGI